MESGWPFQGFGALAKVETLIAKFGQTWQMLLAQNNSDKLGECK